MQSSPTACGVAIEGNNGFGKLFLPLMVTAQGQQCYCNHVHEYNQEPAQHTWILFLVPLVAWGWPLGSCFPSLCLHFHSLSHYQPFLSPVMLHLARSPQVQGNSIQFCMKLPQKCANGSSSEHQQVLHPASAHQSRPPLSPLPIQLLCASFLRRVSKALNI